MDPAQSLALVSAGSRSLLDVSFQDPNRVSTTFRAGEIWSVSRDGSTGLDARGRKKLWNRLKKEVIYRDSPEELEQKERDAEVAQTRAYRETADYKERVAVDLAQAALKVRDKAADLGLEGGTLSEDLAKKCAATLEDDDDAEDDAEDDADDDDDEEDGVPTRNDMFMAKVHTARRVMAQLRPGLAPGPAGGLLGDAADMPKGLRIDVNDAAKKAVDQFLLDRPDLAKKHAEAAEAASLERSKRQRKRDPSPSSRHHHHHKTKSSSKRRYYDDDDDHRDDRHRRRRRDD